MPKTEKKKSLVGTSTKKNSLAIKSEKKNSIFKEFTITRLVVIGAAVTVFILLVTMFSYLLFKFKYLNKLKSYL